MSSEALTLSNIVASLRPPPSVKNGRLQALFSVSNHHHEKPEPIHGFTVQQEAETSIGKLLCNQRPRSGSAGLDCLAALAEKELSSATSSSVAAEPVSTSGSSSEDDESMPPPPPRRPRSYSNPEIETSRVGRSSFLVLPESFLETELAQARAARTSPPSIPEDAEWVETDATDLLCETRSRLLEDLSQSSLQQRKSAKSSSVLPHDLEKYKDVSSAAFLPYHFTNHSSQVYNKDGRIGIYTQQERAAILARFHSKRLRRNWNKKIRYNCRKSLADRRVRVKGRFIKKDEMPDTSDPEAGFSPTPDQPYRRSRRHTVT